MDREHLATVVGRLRSWCDPARGSSYNLRVDLSDAADAIESLVAAVDRLAEEIGIQRATVQPITITHTIGEE